MITIKAISDKRSSYIHVFSDKIDQIEEFQSLKTDRLSMALERAMFLAQCTGDSIIIIPDNTTIKTRSGKEEIYNAVSINEYIDEMANYVLPPTAA